jgi:hypothetical protein
MSDLSKLNVLMCKSFISLIFTVNSTQAVPYVCNLQLSIYISLKGRQGEYTTGWVGTGASKSDKKVCRTVLLPPRNNRRS